MVNVANYARLGSADYFADVGMTVFKMFSTTASDKNFGATDLGSLLRSKQYSHIFVMLGLNEAGSTPTRATWSSCASSSRTPPSTF